VVAVKTGDAKIQEGKFRLIHEVNFGLLRNTVLEIKSALNEESIRSHPLKLFVFHEIYQVIDMLDEFNPNRSKRSLNFIGSTWKWISGSPDHDDLVMIKKKFNNILENNNRQVIINKTYNDRINNITSLTNQIIEKLRTEKDFSNSLIFKLQYKLKLIKEEITNIKYAVHWAKLGIINSLLLSKSEIKFITDILDKENFPYSSPEEALDSSDIKIITNGTCLFYLIDIPLTSNDTYEKLKIKPIINNKFVIKLNFSEILYNKYQIFGLNENCKIVNLTICKKEQIVNLTDSACISNLLRGKNSTCDIVNSHHIPTVDEVAEGVILLNQFNGTALIDEETKNLTGTYLLKIHNSTVTINNRTFISKEAITVKPFPAILRPQLTKKGLESHLSLQYLQEIHINNTKEIALMKEDQATERFIDFGITTTSTITLIIITIGIFIIIASRFNFIISHNQHETVQPRSITPQPHETELKKEETTTDSKKPFSEPIEIPKVKRRTFYDTFY
jgi:hypothetical protein